VSETPVSETPATLTPLATLATPPHLSVRAPTEPVEHDWMTADELAHSGAALRASKDGGVS